MNEPTSEELKQREKEIEKALGEIYYRVGLEALEYERKRRAELDKKWGDVGLEWSDEQKKDYKELNDTLSEMFVADTGVYDNLPEVYALNDELSHVRADWARALVRENKVICSSCFKPFLKAQKRAGTPYKTCPKCREPTHQVKAYRATQKCAHERDFLNCNPCTKNYANERICLLSEEHRLAMIRSLKRSLRGMEHCDNTARILGFDLASRDTAIAEIYKDAGMNDVTSVDAGIGHMRKVIEHLESFGFTGTIHTEGHVHTRRKWGGKK